MLLKQFSYFLWTAGNIRSVISNVSKPWLKPDSCGAEKDHELPRLHLCRDISHHQEGEQVQVRDQATPARTGQMTLHQPQVICAEEVSWLQRPILPPWVCPGVCASISSGRGETTSSGHYFLDQRAGANAQWHFFRSKYIPDIK